MLYDCRKNYDRLNKKEFIMQIIVLINQKGGVGKTACAINIGAGLNVSGDGFLSHLNFNIKINLNNK